MAIKYSIEIEKLMQARFRSLSEKGRRHYAAEEAMKLGHGGISYMSNLLCIDRNTIMVGQSELRSSLNGVTISYVRQRRLGGGRKKKQQLLNY
jgi:hypothetical protein